ncbi:MAG: hypothetical protein GAK35_02754 [Herbaspirillum frisingense]|uniref:Uncharacterized protein n=1 Tax=Herbaspirillum frisingense TaxID=92645 RepID=A0A7V8JTR4_9BURK|nr:MAG: hypothetical protein GAK35_02754 [Herbaspirillum frisingense]
MDMRPPPAMTLELMSKRLHSKHTDFLPGMEPATLTSVLDDMRAHGIAIGNPTAAPFVAPPFHSAWTIHVSFKDAGADILFFVPDEASNRSRT